MRRLRPDHVVRDDSAAPRQGHGLDLHRLPGRHAARPAGRRPLIAEHPVEAAPVASEPTGPTSAAGADWLEAAWLAALLAVAGAAWATLLLAEIGLFRGVVAALAVLCLGAALAVVGLRELSRRVAFERPSRVELVAAAGLLMLGAVVFGRPHEYLLGGLDPGVYANAAVQIGRTGSLVWWDGDVAALSPAARAALFREPPGAFTEGSRLIGFYFGGIEAGRVVPHGVHLLSAAMAVGFVLGGVPGLFLAPPLLALLAVGSVGLLARRWAGGPAGALAALLLIVSPAESWFGRYPAAELWVQVALFGGILVLVLALAAGSERLAFAAGALVGLSHLAKIDTFVVPLAIVLVLGALRLGGWLGRAHLAFGLGYGVILLHALLHVAFVSTQYAYSVYSRSLPPLPVLLGLLVAAAVGLLVVGTRFPAFVRHRERLWLLAIAAVGAAGFYGWYVRPLDPWRELPGLAEGAATAVRNRLHSLPRLGWFVPPLAILLAFAGYALALRRLRGAAAALLLVLLPLEALVVFSDPRITPEYPWAARRWVGLIVPGVVLLASLQLGWLAPRVRAAAALLPAAMAAVLLLSSLGASLPLLRHRDYAGSAALVETIAGSIEPDGVVLFDDDLIGWRFSAPLAHLTGRTSFVLFKPVGEDEQLRAPIAEWTKSGRTLYWLRVGEPGPGFERWGRTWLPGARWATALAEVANTTESPPTSVRRFDVPLTLYRAEQP